MKLEQIDEHLALLNKQTTCTFKKKGAHLLPKMSALVSVNIPGAKMQSHLFGNPAILKLRTRGFASPDYSGFARSENVFSLIKSTVFLLSNAPKNSNVFFG